MLLMEVDFLESLLSVKFPNLRDSMALYHSKLVFDSNWDSRKRSLFLIDHDLNHLVDTLEHKSYFFLMHDISLLNKSYRSYFNEELLGTNFYSQLMMYCRR